MMKKTLFRGILAIGSVWITGACSSVDPATAGGGSSDCAAPQLVCGSACVSVVGDAANCGACGHDCHGQACKAGLCEPEVVASGQESPRNLVADATSLYWSTPNAIVKVPISGGSPTVLATGQAPAGVAVDASSVYWANFDGVMKLPIGGGNPTMVVPAISPVTGVAVDAVNVYWAEGGSGVMTKTPLAGGASVELVPVQQDGGKIQVFALGGQNLYWTTFESGLIVNEPTAGGAPVTLASGQLLPFNLAVDTTHVYWTNFSPAGMVVKVPIAGGTPTVIASQRNKPIGITVDASFVYWAEKGTGSVLKAPIDGGTPIVLAAGQSFPVSVAVDATNVYWTNLGTTDAADGSVMKLAK